MSAEPHLWAIGYDDLERADQVRDEISRLGWGLGNAGKELILLDIAVVRRELDGSYTLNRKQASAIANILGSTGAGFLAGLVLGAPLTGAAIGALLGSAGAAVHVGLDKSFIREVVAMMKPGASALFVLDDEGNMEAVLDGIRGMGGTLLKTNVDMERAMLIQSTLAKSAKV
jgi:uncharacterized membrane protein